MLKSLKSFFKEKMELPPAKSAALQGGRGIKEDRTVQPVQNEKVIQVATCAILLEAAMADNELSGDEIKHIHLALRHLYGMDSADIDELVELTREEGKNAIDIWQFTNLINQHYNEEEKIALMEHIWRVILSDGSLDKFEDYLARKLKPLFRLDHNQWIAAKLSARSFLEDQA